MKNDIIIGAGISGLSFGYFSKKPHVIFEKEKTAGGLCKSFKKHGFTFDCSGHFIHIKDKKIKNLLEKLSDQKFLTVQRNAYILFQNELIPFPFQANLCYLKEKEKNECIKGVINRKNVKIHKDMPFTSWCSAMFGNGITKYFMKPYNQKLWNYNFKNLTAAWTAPFVPKPAEKSIIASACKKNGARYGYNSVFYYPRVDGCGAVINGFYGKLKNSVLTNAEINEIDWKNKTVTAGKTKYQYDNLISTQPLKELIKQLKNPPDEIMNLNKKLSATSVRCLNIGIKCKKEIPKMIKDAHWIYIPEKEYPFYRVGVYSNVCPDSAPKNCYSLYVEFSGKDNRYDNPGDTVTQLKEIGVIGRDDQVVTTDIADMPYAYVAFDKQRDKILKYATEFLNKNGIYSIGRYGAWEYSFIEKNIIDAKKLAEKLNKIK